LSEGIFYDEIIFSKITLTYLTSDFPEERIGTFCSEIKRSMGCQGFIGRIPSTFPDKLSPDGDIKERDTNVVKNQNQEPGKILVIGY